MIFCAGGSRGAASASVLGGRSHETFPSIAVKLKQVGSCTSWLRACQPRVVQGRLPNREH